MTASSERKPTHAEQVDLKVAALCRDLAIASAKHWDARGRGEDGAATMAIVEDIEWRLRLRVQRALEDARFDTIDQWRNYCGPVISSHAQPQRAIDHISYQAFIPWVWDRMKRIHPKVPT